MKTFLCNGSTAINWVIFTARKRILGQGNVFKRVCHSVHSWLKSMHHRSHDGGAASGGRGSASNGRVCNWGSVYGGRVCIQGERVSASRGKMVCIHWEGGLPTGGLGRPPGTGKASGTHPTGMLPSVIS